jgi:hypothetical protein
MLFAAAAAANAVKTGNDKTSMPGESGTMHAAHWTRVRF